MGRTKKMYEEMYLDYFNNFISTQRFSEYYDLLLGEETGRYVFRAVALKEIFAHPKKYGFIFEKEDIARKAVCWRIRTKIV